MDPGSGSEQQDGQLPFESLFDNAVWNELDEWDDLQASSSSDPNQSLGYDVPDPINPSYTNVDGNGPDPTSVDFDAFITFPKDVDDDGDNNDSPPASNNTANEANMDENGPGLGHGSRQSSSDQASPATPVATGTANVLCPKCGNVFVSQMTLKVSMGYSAIVLTQAKRKTRNI